MAITKGSTPSPSPTATAGGDSLSSAAQQFAQQLAAGAGGSDAGRVFMGLQGPSGNTKFMTEAGGSRLVPNWMTTDDATNQYFNWTQKQRDDFRAKGLVSGLLNQGAGDVEAFSLWQTLVKQSALYGAQNKQVGPMDILAGYVKGNSNGNWVKQGNFEVNPVTGEKRYVGPQFTTSTQRQVDLTDPATARAVATKVFQDLLGRDPNQGEISAYASALSQSEAENPSTAITTSQHDMTTGDVIGTNTVTSGGLSADAQAQLAEDQVKGKKEYGVTQAATTYMNALLGAVGS